MVGKEIQYIYFYNNTALPVIVEGWENRGSGLSTLVSTKVEPYQQIIVYSTTGEWYMNSMFYNKEDQDLWKGLEKYNIIGKFRSKPCASRNYSWLEYDEPFCCNYTDVGEEASLKGKNKITGKITLSIL